ncbi:MAG: MFS transporter, partial [Nocardioides sp.]
MRPDERSTADAAAGDEGTAPHPGGGRAGRALRATARGARAAGVATGRGARAAGHATGAAAGYTFRQARRASQAQGAGQSGLSRLIELHAFNAAGDA